MRKEKVLKYTLDLGAPVSVPSLSEPPASTQARGPGRPGWRGAGDRTPNLRWGKCQCWKLLFCVCGEERRTVFNNNKSHWP